MIFKNEEFEERHTALLAGYAKNVCGVVWNCYEKENSSKEICA
jgi:hypothetical protein